MVGIVCALRRELAPLRKQAPLGCRILAAGVGAEAAERGARRLAESERLTAMISAGYAGGLVEAAEPGAIVVDARGQELEAYLPAALRGKIVQRPGLVRTPAERSRLAAATGAVAVDMESEAVSQVAAEYGLPFAAVRAITDGPGAELVLDWDRFQRPDGTLRTASALWCAIRTPKGMAELRQLWYASRKASAALSGFLADFLERWSSRPGADMTSS